MESKNQNIDEVQQKIADLEVKNDGEGQIKEEKIKKEKPKREAKKPVQPVNELYELFKTAELRVGEIVEAKSLPDSDKLYIERINMGDHERVILSGLQKFIPVEGMSGKVIVFCNLKPRKLAGNESNGMVLATSDEKHEKVELLRPHSDAKIGDLVTLNADDFVHSAPESKFINTKNFDKFLVQLRTDETGAPRFENYYLKTAASLLAPSTIVNGNIR